MSSCDILYVKGLNELESDHEEEEEVDMWDDKILNDAYDKAVIIANAEIAKRIAMSTNNRCGASNSKDKASTQLNESKKKSRNKETSIKREDGIQWKVGMPCRATYDVDGAEYEAFLLRMINDKECVVRFLGYENSEIVSLKTLKPSLGNKQRALQIQEALNDNERKPSHNDKDAMQIDYESDCGGMSGSIPDKSHKKKKSKKKNEHKNIFPPNLSNMSQMAYGLLDHPIPPPPPMLSPSAKTNPEDQAIHSMLLSWYMTGYYTGLYQGMKNSKKSGRCDDN